MDICSRSIPSGAFTPPTAMTRISMALAVLIRSPAGSPYPWSMPLAPHPLAISPWWPRGLALDAQGPVWSWGSTDAAVIGRGVYRCNTGGNYRALPGPVVDESGTGQLAGIGSIKASYDHGLALKTDGTVLVWGRAGAGLGQGSKRLSLDPWEKNRRTPRWAQVLRSDN